jgi:type 1 glutamine amidotransferase
LAGTGQGHTLSASNRRRIPTRIDQSKESLMSKAISTVAVLALLAGALACLSSDLSAAEPVKAKSEAKAKPIRVVILVGGHGYDKKNFPKAWGGHADIQCEVWKGKPYTVFDDISAFKYDVVLMYNLSSGITDKQKANFLTLLKKGMGLIVWHHALANCQDWPEFEKIAGGKFWMKPGERAGKKVGKSGTGHDKYKMHIADANHPITQGMTDFEIQDESYNKQTFADGIHLLVTTDHPKSDKQVAWVHEYSGARVMGYQSGHDARAWTNPGHRQILCNGIRWVARRLGVKTAPKS